MIETHITIRLLWLYFPQNWEFGSALSKLQNFEGVVEHRNLPPQYKTDSACEQLAGLATLI
jgi:hypothetical protein